MKKPLIYLIVFVSAVILFSGCSKMITDNPGNIDNTVANDEIARGGSPKYQPTIVDIAAGNADFSVLVEAVIFAGLDGVLSGKGQYTVFAPTNAAFVALLGDLGLTKEQLLAPGNEGLVKGILLYHVIRGERFANSIVTASRVRTLAKEFAFVDGATIGNSTYGYANIVAVNIDASNGVVHVLDKVILPASLVL